VKRSTPIVALMIALVVALVGAALSFVLGGGGKTGDAGGNGDGAEIVTGSEDAGGAAATRSRGRATGNAALHGLVVRGKEREPAAGQEVLLAGVGPQPLRAVADETGAFRFEKLPAGGPYELTAAAAGFATVRLPGIALGRDDDADVGTLVLDAAVRLVVRVRTWSDQPLAGASVSVFAAQERGRDYDWTRAMAQMAQTPVAVATVAADQDGEAVFPELAVGRWSVVATHPGYARGGRSGATLSREFGDPDPMIVRLEPGGTLTGRVFDPAGEPLPDVTVIAGRQQDSWNWHTAPLQARHRTRADGRYELTALPAGPLLLRVMRDKALPVPAATVMIPDVTEFDIRLKDGATVTGRVTRKEDGSPVAGAEITVSTWRMMGSGGTARGTSGEDGRYVVSGVLPGMLGGVVAKAEGLTQATVPAGTQTNIDPGAVIERDLKLVPGAALTGVVSGPDGPIAGARVTAMGGNISRGLDSRSAETDASGRYRIADVGAGRYVVSASAKGLFQKNAPTNPWQMIQSNATSEWSIKLAAGAETTFDIALQAGVRIAGRVQNESGDPLASVHVSTTMEHGWSPNGTAMPRARTGEDGAFVLEGVPQAAVMRVNASLDRYVVVGDEQKFDTTSGEAIEEVMIRLRRAPVVAGAVVGTTGEPVPDAYVQVTWSEPQSGDRGLVVMSGMGEQDPFLRAERHPVAADGAYEIPLAWTAGRIRVRASAPGHAARTSDHVTLAKERDRYEVDLQMEAGASIAGRVIAEETGLGLPRAHVSISRVVAPQSGNVIFAGSGFRGDSAPVVAVADADGMFAVSRLEPGTYRVEARFDGRVTIDESARSPASDVVLKLAQALSITGVVVDGGGQGVPGLTVSAQKSGQANVATNLSFVGGGSPGTGNTDSQGRFAVRDLKPGSYELHVESQWNAPVNIEGFTSQPYPAGSTGVKLVVDQGIAIGGRVVDSDGEGVGSAQIIVQGDGTWRNAQSQPDGKFTVGGLTADATELKVTVQVPSWLGRSLRAVHRTVSPGQTDLEFVLEPGLEIEGRLRREDGLDLPEDTTLGAAPLDRKNSENMYFGNSNTRVDADGSFRIGGLDEGDYKITLDASDDGRALTLRGGEKLTAGSKNVELIATFGMSITGRVRTEGGASLEHVTIQTHPSSGGSVTTTKVKADGSFQVTGLDEGKSYNLAVQGPGLLGGSVSEVAAGRNDVELSVKQGVKATGRILSEGGEPLAGAQMWVSGPGVRSSTNASTDQDGRFVLEGLEEGMEYTVSVFVQQGSSFTTKSAGKVVGGQTDATLQLEKDEPE